MLTRRHQAVPFLLAGVAGIMLQTLHAQAPASDALAFEVATIKPSEPPAPGRGQFGGARVMFGMQVDAGRVNIRMMSLMEIIAAAYRLKPYQVTGPGWLTMERFDIMAKIPDGVSKDKVPEMLQALLAERFKMTQHRETKDHAVYALVVAKGGPKLKEVAPDTPGTDDAPPPDPNSNGGQIAINREKGAMVITGSRAGTMRMTMNPGGTMRMEGTKMTAPVLADFLSRFVDRPVVDATGLTGTYDVMLDLSMDDMRYAARNAGMGPPGPGPGGPGGPAAEGARPPGDSASDPSGGSSMFAAIQSLGLKLEPRKAPLESVTVDRIEKTPTEN